MKKTVKICVYNKTSSKNDVLLGNGDAILDNICIECKVHENLDGTYEIDAEFIIDNEGLWENLEEEAILKVRLDYGYEYFRITQPRKTSNRIIVYGRQVTIYETMHLWLTDVRPENQDGAGALHWILDHATGIKELEVASDIQTVSTAYYMDMNMYEALHDCDQSFFNRWGGEIQRRGYTLRINQRIGTDRGVEIRSRKNLTGFEANTNIDNVVTRIKPKGFDGITIDGYVDSEYINKYPRIKTKEIKYEDVKLKDENNPDDGYETLAEAQAELTRLAKLEFTENKIDVITAEYNISFVDLSKTEEYKEYVQAERVYLGDTVNVYEEKLDINVSVRAIDRVYDVLGERVEEIKLSNKDINKLHSMNDILTDILKGVQENDNSLQLYIQNIINSGIQDSYVFYNKAELVICDSPEIENAINVWRFNRGGLAHSSNGYSGPYNVAMTYDGKINADMILAGLIKGNYIDARNLTVTRTDGTKTLEITAGGDVNLNVTSLKINNKNVIDGEEVNSLINQTADEIKTNVTKLQGMGQKNLLFNTDYTQDYKYWNYGSSYTWIDSSYLTPNGNTSMTLDVSSQTSNMYIGASQILQTKLVPGQQYSLSFYYFLYEALPPDYGFGVEVKGNDGSGIEKNITIYSETENYTFGVWRRVEITFTMNNYTSPFVYIYLKRNGRITFGDFKLVRGTSTGSWDPAPEDSKDYAESKISQTAENIRTEVSQIYSTKSELSVVDQKANSISASVASKVGNDEIISKINMSPESISIQANKIDMTGAMNLHGTFTCYSDESNHNNSNKLVQSGAIVRGYLAGYNYPVFSSGLWNPTQTAGEDMGYVSVGWGNSDHVDQYGCLYMSPIVLGGGQIVYSKLDDNNNSVKSGINFKKDGSVEYMSFHPQKTTVGAISHSFDGGIDCLTLKARDGIINGSLYIDSTLYTDSDSLYFVAGGYGNQYYLSLQKTGYLIPFGTGGIQLGDAVNPFTTLYCTNAPVVMSDEKKKKDIQYLDSTTYSIKQNQKLNINTEDMYNFVKNDLKLASYKLKDSNKDKKDKTELGFIAQDIKDTKVGKYIVDDNGDNLMYDMGNRISVLEGALQKAIEKIEMLEELLNSRNGE